MIMRRLYPLLRPFDTALYWTGLRRPVYVSTGYGFRSIGGVTTIIEPTAEQLAPKRVTPHWKDTVVRKP
jgi:hypothetical protein